MTVPRCYRCKVRSLECQYQHTPPVLEKNNAPPGLGQQPFPILVDCEAFYGNSGLHCNMADEMPNGIDSVCKDTPVENILPPFPDYNLDWQEVMENIQDFAVPDQLKLNDSPSRSVLAGEIYQARIIYSVKQMKAIPGCFVSKGRTSFIHNHLYEPYTPQAIQDVLGVCALYGRKTESNQDLVYRIISQLADRIVSHFETVPVLEQLASVQALTLLQIIRLFDGDIRQRADAERTEPLFVAWIRQLQHRSQQILGTEADIMCPSSSSKTVSWQDWLFAESVRRTIIVGYTLQGLYCFLKNGWDDSHHEFENLSFYAQNTLWAATSESQWQSVLKRCHPIPVRFSSWDEDISAARPVDIENLGMMMMVLIKGIDHCSLWAGDHYSEMFGLVS